MTTATSPVAAVRKGVVHDMSMFSMVRTIILAVLGAKDGGDNSGVKVTFGGVMGIGLLAGIMYMTTGKIDGGMIAELRSLLTGVATTERGQAPAAQQPSDEPDEELPASNGPRVIDDGEVLIIPGSKK